MGPRRRHPPDEQLLRRTATDGEAFGLFYDRYEHAVLLYVRRRVATAELAADLTAEIFAAALEQAPAFAGRDGATAVGWLFAIARNVVVDAYRRARVADDARRRLGVPPTVVTDEAVELIERLVATAAGSVALEALAALPAAQRDAVRQHVLEDRSYPEIAAQLECSTAVVRQRVSRGLAALRKEVQLP
ncbi:RNA polymerase sigma factor [Patulibacter sp. SYSU D01012]|uniref:RNA polymerase sigma factor n=1 Tax=Patulibacter sp. SYSU D01012 TaxID=2817381 RepID=UPI001B3138E6|nr:RNA polymerase sigma factor [Patulibacter sp. SYSU D01012]